MTIESDLAVGKPLHKHVLDAVWQRRTVSARKMRDYHQQWDDADDAFVAYQPTSEVDARKKARRKSEGIHDYTTITVPYTFAIIMTAHTYWSTVFLSRAPIYQLTGRHGETQDSVEAFEAVLDYQRTVGEHVIRLFNWVFDMSKYGLGITGSYWENREVTISRQIEKPMTFLGVPLANRTQKVWESATVPTFQGNCLYNIRPYDWFPDPRVAIVDFQRGEFCGRDTQVPWHEILDQARNGYYFNIDELASRVNQSSGGTWMDQEMGSPRVNLPEQANEIGADKIPGPGFVRLHEQYIRIIPQAWGLSPGARTEVWKFTIANGSLVIGAQPQGLYHDDFPFDIMEFGFGAHDFCKMSLTQIMGPLVDTISWLLNSHFFNVRKALNDVRVVDPSRVTMKDLTSPVDRGIIRLKPEAYGTDPRQAIHQLITPDMTQSHLRDIQIMEEMLQRITGVVDDLMGLPGGPSRESATGVRTRTGAAANRLKTIAEYNSALGFSRLISKLVSNTQQLMTLEQKFKIAGVDGLKNAKRFVDVKADMIAGFYDFVPVDGTMPIDRLAQANFWKELTMQLAASPLAAQWNLMEMVAHIMRLQGEKNVDRFRLDVVAPDQLAGQVQAGNVVPINPRGGSGVPRTTGSTGGTI